MSSYTSILFATDFSRSAMHAARRAREVATRFNARLHIIHVVEEAVLYDEDIDRVMGNPFVASDRQLEMATATMKSFSDSLGFGDEVSYEVVPGRPKATVVEWAREHDINLIVVGSHGRRGIDRLLGSVSSGISHRAHCDVLIVKE